MSFDRRNNTSFTAVQVTAIRGAITTIKTNIQAAFPVPINLSPQQRRGARTISNVRYPFARRAITEFGVSFPGLSGAAVPVTRVTVNWELYNQTEQINTELAEVVDMLTDLNINSGVICMEFTDDQYTNAERARGRDVEGADTVYEAQNPLYDREDQEDESEEDDTEEGGGGPEDGPES